MTGQLGADTSFLIDFFKGEKNAATFMQEHASKICISNLVIYEFLCSNLMSKEVTTFFSGIKSFPTVQFDRESAVVASTLFRHGKKTGKPSGHADCAIAGSYVSVGIKKIVTRNVKHFKGMQSITVQTY